MKSDIVHGFVPGLSEINRKMTGPIWSLPTVHSGVGIAGSTATGASVARARIPHGMERIGAKTRSSQSREANWLADASGPACGGTDVPASGEQSPSGGGWNQCANLLLGPDAQSQHGTARNSPGSIRGDVNQLYKYDFIGEADNENDDAALFLGQEDGVDLVGEPKNFEDESLILSLEADGFETLLPMECCGGPNDSVCGSVLNTVRYNTLLCHSRLAWPGPYDHEARDSMRCSHSPAASMFSVEDYHCGGHTVKCDERGDGCLVLDPATTGCREAREEEAMSTHCGRLVISGRPLDALGWSTARPGCTQDDESAPMCRPTLEFQPPVMQQEAMMTPTAAKARKKGFGGSAIFPPPPVSGAGKRKARSKKATPAKRSKTGARDDGTPAPAARKGKNKDDDKDSAGNEGSRGKISTARDAKAEWDLKAKELQVAYMVEMSRIQQTSPQMAKDLQRQMELLPTAGYFNQRKCLVLFFSIEIMLERVTNVTYGTDGKFSSFSVSQDRDQSWLFVQGLFNVFGRSIVRENESLVYLGVEQQFCQTLHQAIKKFGLIPDAKGGGVWNKAFRGELKLVQAPSKA